MFSKILFYHDENGKPLIDASGTSHYDQEAPRTLTAKHCSASGFFIQSYDDSRVHAVQIIRVPISEKKDPWNETDPCVVMTAIVWPHFYFLGEMSIEIIGFENPNLCCGGLLKPAFVNCGCKPVEGAPW